MHQHDRVDIFMPDDRMPPQRHCEGMKRTHSTKLSLSRTTLRRLDGAELRRAAGGTLLSNYLSNNGGGTGNGTSNGGDGPNLGDMLSDALGTVGTISAISQWK